MDALLDCHEATKGFGGLLALDRVAMQVHRGTIQGLIGPNGAGKTTLFNCLTGVYGLDRGDIFFKGRAITGWRPHRITALGIARTFQNLRLFKGMSVLEHVLVGMHCRQKAGLWGILAGTRASRGEEREGKEKARELLAFVGLEGKGAGPATALPYGDQRRLEIARALAADPEVLLLDEPTAGMNPSETRALTGIMERLRRERGLTLLLIEHDMRVVMGLSDRITVLDHGLKIAEGPPAEIRRNPRVIEAYLGRSAGVGGLLRRASRGRRDG